MIDKTLSHYRILEKVGAGGMGVVYRAHDERLDRDVAVKVLPAGALADEAARKRFHKEAIALSRLNHPYIGTVYDFDTQEGADFLVMEYIPGVTLAEKLAAGPLLEREIARLGVQLAEGLASAHAQGVVHRDLKPANLRVTPDGRLKILDFGLAKLLRPVSAATSDSVAESQVVSGTVPYMSPEQLRGEATDARTDIYAAGAVLYEMATGQRPFPETHGPRLIDAILHEATRPPSALNHRVSPGLESIVLKCLDKEPARRYQSARELLVDLERLTIPVPVVGAPPRRQLARRWVLSAAVLLIVALAGVGYLFRGRFRPARTTASERVTIMVLPFQNLGPTEQEYFADGLTDEIISRLTGIQGLGVISRTSAMKYKNTDKSTKQIGEELGVQYILEGTVRWEPTAGGQKRVRVTPQLIRVSDDTHLWAESYDAVMAEIFTLQSDIASKVAQAMHLTLLEPAQAQQLPSAKPTENLEAYDYYLRGNALAQGFTESDLRQAQEMFDKAVALDPEFALAYAKLAEVHARMYLFSYDRSPERLNQATAAVDKALQLNPGLPEAHLARGYIEGLKKPS